MKTIKSLSSSNNTILSGEISASVSKVEHISKIKPARINWDKYPEAVTDMEAGADGKRRNNHMDYALDEIDERIITLDTSKFENR